MIKLKHIVYEKGLCQLRPSALIKNVMNYPLSVLIYASILGIISASSKHVVSVTVWFSAQKMVIKTFSPILNLHNESLHEILQLSIIYTLCCSLKNHLHAVSQHKAPSVNIGFFRHTYYVIALRIGKRQKWSFLSRQMHIIKQVLTMGSQAIHNHNTSDRLFESGFHQQISS